MEEKITPEPRADDAEFYRRLSLDLIGRLPTSAEAREFIDSPNDRKRDQAIDRLLASPEHADHFANVWRSLLITEADADRQLRFFLPGFEAWLKKRRNENARFDVVVRELLAVPITVAAARPQPVLTDMRAPNPIAFIAAKESSPSKLAAAATRLFLGVRLECAECHNHPFDSWTQQQFWNQAAFFAGVERKGRGPFALVFEKPETRSIAMMSDESKVVSVKYLTGAEPTFDDGANPRAKLAEWITSRDNELFARAIANRVWGQFLGRGIVDPVDDFSDANPPSHPELLTDLAAEFTASGYDLTHLYRVVCRTAAFQRTSKSSSLAPSDPQAFARMAVKPMSGEQFYDSLPQAIALEQLPPSKAMTRNEDPVRRKFFEAFGPQGDQRDPETSVVRALTLMNGSLIDDATKVESSGLLKSLASNAGATTDTMLEGLYLAVLSRRPTPDELARLRLYVGAAADEAERGVKLGDVLWMLLNSAEFRWNH